MPDPTNLPPGCKFSPRCPQCMPVCKTTPPAETVFGIHKICCHLFQDERKS
jgi:peptide/nickel transport system ATP-binding protein